MTRGFWMVGLCFGCTPALELGTYEPGAARTQPLGTTASGLSVRVGEIGILEGDDTLISPLGDQYGLVIDDQRNDLAAVTRRFADTLVDREAVLLLFTTFDDRGAAGPAYYVPFYRDTEGLGVPPLDQRADFGVVHLRGVANLKSVAHHTPGRLLPRALHELAHPALAYLSAAVASSTVPIPLLGRQNAHWHAALHTEGSVLGGHGYAERGPGEFQVIGRNSGYSRLDRYGLGLLAPEQVPPFFFIAGARTITGATLPAAAELPLGTLVRGQKIEVKLEDVVRAVGPRSPAFPEAPPRLEVVVGLLTAPGESASSTRAVAIHAELEVWLPQLAERYTEETGGVGVLCLRLDGCDPVTPEPPPPPPPAEGCSCRGGGPAGPSGGLFGLGLVAAALRRRRSGRSFDRFRRRV
ncbi:MAG: hypothetical protein IPG45_03410 [Deltaproteobacteria bacterium]|nr:hypothetical protein [Deltaproteobacteria bacterium]